MSAIYYIAISFGIIFGLPLLLALFINRRPVYRFLRNLLNRVLPFTTPSWKIALRVIHPELGRPRYLSLHTLAALTDRDDLLQLAKEMKNSCEVGIAFCPTVRSPVFFLFTRRRDGSEPEIWNRIEDFIETWPYPQYKGFYGAVGHWTGGFYGVGFYVAPVTAMTEPFIKEDYAYANKIIGALRNAGYEPGIQEYNI